MQVADRFEKPIIGYAAGPEGIFVECTRNRDSGCEASVIGPTTQPPILIAEASESLVMTEMIHLGS